MQTALPNDRCIADRGRELTDELSHGTTRIGDQASAPLRAELDEVLAALHLEPAIKPLVP